LVTASDDESASRLVWPPVLGLGTIACMDLRDQFAAQCAAALAGVFSDAAQVARRAYDMADALLAERARRVEADEARAIADEAALIVYDALFDPDAVDPDLLEPPYDPTWDLDDAHAMSDVARGPGLVRARSASDEMVEASAQRSAG
jgi:hypothetical protein